MFTSFLFLTIKFQNNQKNVKIFLTKNIFMDFKTRHTLLYVKNYLLGEEL